MAFQFTISAQNLSKRFNREWIFRNFTYKFTSGSTYAITGPNGSGKSTLLQVLWGQMPQSGGSLLYRNHREIPLEGVFNHLTIAAPYMDLIDEFTLEEQVAFHFKLKKARNDLSVSEIISKMRLDDARTKPLSNFSSGMKQRVKLGLAFYTKADAIFLDEPGTNLDKQVFTWYLETLSQLEDSLIIIASNDPSEYSAKALTLNIMDYK